MILYHGTSERWMNNILRVGIKPRGRKDGNWQHTVTSNPFCVYLTRSYAIHFATAASRGTERLALIEVETDRLDELCLLPDEDFLEQVTRDHHEFADQKPWGMKRRTLWFRKRLMDYSHMRQACLDHMGTCCYLGSVPVSAIRRYALMPANGALAWASDPTITPLNYKIMGEHYRELMRYVFDGEVETYDHAPFMVKISKLPRDGVEVINVNP